MWIPFTALTRSFRLCLLALLVCILADVAGSVWVPVSDLWSHVLSNGYYVGILFAAVGFGLRGGLVAAAVAAISHVIVMIFGPSGMNAQWGEAAGFILFGLLAGFIAQRRKKMKGETTSKLNQASRTSAVRLGPADPGDPFANLGLDAPSLLHELRTPLASIEGAGFVLEDESLPEDKRREFVAIILKECQRLDLLVGLIGASHSYLEQHQLDVSSLLDDVIREAGGRADAASHPLRKAILPVFPHLTCNSELIRQIVLNLTVNAMQATPPGREIVLSAHSIDNQVFIEVIDQRLGVGEESLDSMLDRSSPNEHWRIQLATARQVAVRHGGAVKVKRNESSGITTSIVLPGNC
jgi:two-component system, NtrC family, sensor histidine kinase HydH